MRTQRRSRPAFAEGGKPGRGRRDSGRPVEAEGDELGAPADILPRHRAAEPLLGQREAAVGGAVAIVAHQEQAAGWNGDRAEVVALRIAKLDRIVAYPVGQGLADDRQAAISTP